MDFSSRDRNRSHHHHHHRKPLFTYDKEGVKRYKKWLADGRNQDKNKGHNIIISVEESGNESSERVGEKQSYYSKVECRKSSHDMHGGKVDNVTDNNFDENDDVRPTLSSSTNIGNGLDVFCWRSGKNNSSIENKDMIINKSPIVCQRKHNEYIIESTTPEPVEPSSEIVKRNLLGNGCFSESFSENKHLSVTNIVNEPDCEKVIEYEHAKGIKTKLKKEDKSTMENDESSCIEFFAPINQKKDLSSDGSSLKSTKHACIGSRNSSDHQVQIIDLTNETNYSSSLSNNPKKCSNSEDATMISSNQKGVYRKLNFSGPILTKNCNQIAEQIDSIDKIDTQKITQAVVSEKNTNEIEKCSLVSHTCQYSNNTSTKWDHLWKYDGIVSHCSAVNVNMAEAPVPCKVIEIKEEKEIFNQNDSMFTHQEKNENHPSQEIESDQQIVKDDNCQSEINFSPRYDKENNHGVLIKSETDANREMESESHYECQNESDFEEEEDEETLSMKVESGSAYGDYLNSFAVGSNETIGMDDEQSNQVSTREKGASYRLNTRRNRYSNSLMQGGSHKRTHINQAPAAGNTTTKKNPFKLWLKWRNKYREASKLTDSGNKSPRESIMKSLSQLKKKSSSRARRNCWRNMRQISKNNQDSNFPRTMFIFDPPQPPNDSKRKRKRRNRDCQDKLTENTQPIRTNTSKFKTPFHITNNTYQGSDGFQRFVQADYHPGLPHSTAKTTVDTNEFTFTRPRLDFKISPIDLSQGFSKPFHHTELLNVNQESLAQVRVLSNLNTDE